MDVLMQPSPFVDVLGLVIGHSYFFIFGAMVVEGPIVTAAAAFAAALGYLDLPIVMMLSFFGDMVGDLFYFSLGYWGRLRFVEKYGHRFGLTPHRLERISSLIQTHPVKTLIASKYIPFLSMSGLITAGLSHFSPRRFLLLDILITIPNTIFFSFAGFYFGLAFDQLFRYFRNLQYAALIIIVLALALMFVYRKLFNFLYSDFEREVEEKEKASSHI